MILAFLALDPIDQKCLVVLLHPVGYLLLGDNIVFVTILRLNLFYDSEVVLRTVAYEMSILRVIEAIDLLRIQM